MIYRVRNHALHALNLNLPNSKATDSIATTLHYQMIYRVRNHALHSLDLNLPCSEATYSIATTLYYQMIYRVQNHAFHALDLYLPNSKEALLISIGRDQTSCVHIPKQLPRDQLVKLLPNS